MKKENENFDDIINIITSKIKNQEIAIFCGAGISYNSGLPLVNNLLRYILNVIEVNEIDSEKILQSNLPFEAFIQTLSGESDVNDLLDIFSKGKPNNTHRFIALLIKLGFVKNIITTNFDTLIEQALSEIGFEKENHFDVYSSDKDFEKIDWDYTRIKIIKIHGCISNKDEMEITLDLIARRFISQNKHNIISSFFSKKINQNVLFLGYSCSDLFDITPQINSILNNQSEIIFIEHSVDDTNFCVEEVSKKEFKNPFYKYKGLRFYVNTDILVNKFWEKFSSEDYPTYPLVNIDWKTNINAWIIKGIKYSEAIKNQLKAKLFYDIGEYNISIETWEQGLAIAQKEKNQLFFYAQLGNLGMAFNAIGKFNEAKKCLEESSKACKDIGNIQGEISQLQALGNIYRNLGDFENAITVFERAVFLAEDHFLESLCPSLGNLATVYNQTKNFEKALDVLQKGLAIALTTGNKQSEGSMLTSIGIALFQKGNYKKATEFILRSIEVTKQIGDKQGECMALHNLSNFSLQFQEFDNCIKYSTQCLTIALEINIKPSEAAALYNIGSAYFFKGNQNLAVQNLEKSVEINNEIFGLNHSHTISAIQALDKAKNLK